MLQTFQIYEAWIIEIRAVGDSLEAVLLNTSKGGSSAYKLLLEVVLLKVVPRARHTPSG